MYLRYLCALALAGAGLPALPVLADDLTLSAALERALAESPEVLAARADIAASEAQAALDGLPPVLTVGGELESVAGTGDLEGVDAAETTVRLGRTFELGGKREARAALASSRTDSRRNAERRVRLDIEAETRRRFVDVLARQENHNLAARALQAARELRDVVARRVERGATPEADLALAELALVRAELDVEDAAHELASARVALSVLWGERTPAFTRAAGALDAGTDPPTFEALAARMADGPDERALALEVASLDAAARIARAEAQPDVHATVGVRRLEASDDQALVLSVSMPVGLGARSEHALTRTHAERASVDARRQALGLERHRRLYASYEELLHARHELEALRERMVPAGERALDLSMRGYERAGLSFLQVAQAQRVVHDLHQERIAAAARYQNLLIDIERATAQAE